MALSTGLETTQINFANIENKGIEFEIKANIIDNKDWNWFVGFNIDSGRQELGFDLRGIRQMVFFRHRRK